jgi:hypothetical protein
MDKQRDTITKTIKIIRDNNFNNEYDKLLIELLKIEYLKLFILEVGCQTEREKIDEILNAYSFKNGLKAANEAMIAKIYVSDNANDKGFVEVSTKNL